MLKKIAGFFNKKEELQENIEETLIQEDMTLAEVLQQYPQTLAVFNRYGIHCMGCHISHWETLAQGAKAHGVDLERLLTDLNQAIQAN